MNFDDIASAGPMLGGMGASKAAPVGMHGLAGMAGHTLCWGGGPALPLAVPVVAAAKCPECKGVKGKCTCKMGAAMNFDNLASAGPVLGSMPVLVARATAPAPATKAVAVAVPQQGALAGGVDYARAGLLDGFFGNKLQLAARAPIPPPRPQVPAAQQGNPLLVQPLAAAAPQAPQAAPLAAAPKRIALAPATAPALRGYAVMAHRDLAAAMHPHLINVGLTPAGRAWLGQAQHALGCAAATVQAIDQGASDIADATLAALEGMPGLIAQAQGVV